MRVFVAAILALGTLAALAGVGLKRPGWRAGQTINIVVRGATTGEIGCLESTLTAFHGVVPLSFRFLPETSRADVLLDIQRPVVTQGPARHGSSDVGNRRWRQERMTLVMHASTAFEGYDAALCERARWAILHEFGHLVGLKHEHQHPDAPASLRERLLQRYEGIAAPSNFVLLRRHSSSQYAFTPYDVLSIMHYDFSWTDEMAPDFGFDLTPWSSTNAHTGVHHFFGPRQLSEGDIEFLRSIY